MLMAVVTDSEVDCDKRNDSARSSSSSFLDRPRSIGPASLGDHREEDENNNDPGEEDDEEGEDNNMPWLEKGNRNSHYHSISTAEDEEPHPPSIASSRPHVDTESFPRRHRSTIPAPSPSSLSKEGRPQWSPTPQRTCSTDSFPSSAISSPNQSQKQRNRYLALLFGQFIALLASSMNATSFTLSYHYHVQTQFFQLFWIYLLLSIHLFLRRPLRAPPAADDDALPTTTVEPTLSAPTTAPNQLDPCYETPSRGEEEMRAATSPSTDPSSTHDSDTTPATTTSRRPFALPGSSLRLLAPWWIYLGMSLLDVLPNFLALLAFRYTSLTSASLLGSLTVPSTMLFSRYILRRSFGLHHYIGVCLCLLGGTLTIWADASTTSSSPSHSSFANDTTTTTTTTPPAPHPESYAGDILAIIAALLYGLGDTVSEYSIKHIDREEYLGMLGLFGLLLTGLIFPWRERHALMELADQSLSTKWQASAVLAVYILSVVLYYLTATAFLISSDATLLNLSLQATNLWAILFSVVAYREVPVPSFYLAVFLVLVGVGVYEMGGGPSTSPRTSEAMAEAELEALENVDDQTPHVYQQVHPPREVI